MRRGALAVLLVLAGCGTGTAETAAPAARVSSTAAPSAEPPVRTAPQLHVALRDVVLQALPDGADRDVAAAGGHLSEGEWVWIVDTMVVGEQTWHLVAATSDAARPERPFGWTTEAVDGAPAIRPADVACPGLPLRPSELAALGDFGGLACFAGEAVTLDGYAPLACGMGSTSVIGTPDWLNGVFSGLSVGDEQPRPPDFEADWERAANVRIAPGSSVRAGCGHPGWYRFTGHFDDPASAECHTTDTGRVMRFDPRLEELLCRARLVVTEQHPIAPPP